MARATTKQAPAPAPRDTLAVRARPVPVSTRRSEMEPVTQLSHAPTELRSPLPALAMVAATTRLVPAPAPRDTLVHLALLAILHTPRLETAPAMCPLPARTELPSTQFVPGMAAAATKQGPALAPPQDTLGRHVPRVLPGTPPCREARARATRFTPAPTEPPSTQFARATGPAITILGRARVTAGTGGPLAHPVPEGTPRLGARVTAIRSCHALLERLTRRPAPLWGPVIIKPEPAIALQGTQDPVAARVPLDTNRLEAPRSATR